MSVTIKRPVISEKSVLLTEQGKYVFLASPKSSKKEVKKAIEELFKVKVLKVHSIKIPGKVKTYKRIQGKQSDRHKFIVTLKQGDKIELFEGAK